jgi:hypothetical protein
MSFGASATFDDRQRQGRPDVRPDVPSSGYAGYGIDTIMDDYEDEQRQRADPQAPRQHPSSRYQEFFLPGEGIMREVIRHDICRYLGNDATVRPYQHTDVGLP